ncbi:MAG TPA: FHA domain-containing protein [Longimicrobiaceae bacterium]|nr:FHA domain-containing protein [Longimicrobiaceae bacterium]
MSTTDPPRSRDPLAAFVPASEPEGSSLPVTSTTVHVGQGPQNEVVLDDDTVSTRHARLEYVAGGWMLTDLESKNGTFVDGVRLAPGIPTPLPSHAEVAFGAYALTFLPDADADPEAPAADRGAPEESVPLAERSVFRLPVWLFVLILLLVALLVALLVVFGGDPATVEPVVDPTTAFGHDPFLPVAA